ncbi:pseudouridine synthase [Hasllibacter sp. MH4015]|uniref:pseudouridine synthase n=1 Tax=Hasllibacter sp. MH4015 TaxID=2854029 RepID=UPI001CD34C98|nr:pseudouridine synthase [Hasllibacter sp. MH4015]
MLIAFNKPMNVLSQFTSEGGWPALDRFGLPKGVYAAGRLDRDSEGLLLLTDDGGLQARISSPKFKKPKVYFALVEGVPDTQALKKLAQGVRLKDGQTAPCGAEAVPAPDWIWARNPPVRIRKSITDTWLKLTLSEGKNRQVRRMCAAVGCPVIRLVRWSIGPHDLAGLAPGQWREVVGV